MQTGAEQPQIQDERMVALKRDIPNWEDAFDENIKSTKDDFVGFKQEVGEWKIVYRVTFGPHIWKYFHVTWKGLLKEDFQNLRKKNLSVCRSRGKLNMPGGIFDPRVR